VQQLIGADAGHGRWWHASATGSICHRVRPFSDLQLERYARHIVLPEIGGAGQRRLLSARVVVVGAGGIGAGLLPWLAAAGIGRIRLIDDDHVSLSNLQRQTLFTRADVGALKVERAARALARFNPDCAAEPIAARLDADNVAILLAGADVVVDGCDNFETRLLVADWCHAARVPLVSAAVGPFDAQLSTFRGWEPGMACYRCLVGDEPRASERSCADAGVLGALVGAIGALAAIEVMREIAGFGEGLAGRLLLVDALGMRQRTVGLTKDDGCSVCGAPGREAPTTAPA
jgi:molybdopterin/thiamine biosynthesis adenylyltransferase